MMFGKKRTIDHYEFYVNNNIYYIIITIYIYIFIYIYIIIIITSMDLQYTVALNLNYV